MNLPNKITMFRVVLIPFFVFFMLSEHIAYHNYIAVAIFIVASLTDMLDGKIARKYNLLCYDLFCGTSVQSYAGMGCDRDHCP